MSRVAGAFFAGNTEGVVELERRERSDRSVMLEEKIIGVFEGAIFGSLFIEKPPNPKMCFVAPGYVIAVSKEKE